MLVALVGLTLSLRSSALDPGGTAPALSQRPTEQAGTTSDDAPATPNGRDEVGPVATPRPEARAEPLPAAEENVRLVGRVTPRDPGTFADVAALGGYAYLGEYDCPNAGVHVIDLADPAHPRPVAFVRSAGGSHVGEGVQVIRMSTSAFTGDLLVYNNEICLPVPTAVGGVTLVDVTNPASPAKLVDGAGDLTGPDGRPAPRAHQIHSAFAWTTGPNAYVVLVDDEEARDVDIMDITDPRKPVLISETDVNEYDVAQPTLALSAAFLHDVVVKKIGPDYIMLLSCWDGGHVRLNVNDPANPVFLGDTDYRNLDPERLARGHQVRPEGNGHQAEFSRDNAFFLATDEDLTPTGVSARIASGPSSGQAFSVVQGSGVPQIDGGRSLAGESVFVGQACSSLPPAPSGVEIAIVERGTCSFTDKVRQVAAAGYQGGIVFNHTAAGGCERVAGILARGPIPFLFVSRIDGFRILNVYDPQTYGCTEGGASTPSPTVGTAGANLELTGAFDGWGYVHLYDAKTMQELDTYAIAESQDAASSSGRGWLSVHEVATDPDRDLAYFSYYAGGFRVVSYSRAAGIREVGRYIAEGGNNFWGVEVHKHPNGEKYILASDIGSGLWIFQYTGPLR